MAMGFTRDDIHKCEEASLGFSLEYIYIYIPEKNNSVESPPFPHKDSISHPQEVTGIPGGGQPSISNRRGAVLIY